MGQSEIKLNKKHLAIISEFDGYYIDDMVLYASRYYWDGSLVVQCKQELPPNTQPIYIEYEFKQLIEWGIIYRLADTVQGYTGDPHLYGLTDITKWVNLLDGASNE